MPYELIITEKPDAAKRIAESLADGKTIRKSEGQVSYYLLTRNGKDIVVASAVGHLYGVAEKNDKTWEYPVFEVEWRPSYEIDKGADYTKKYIDVLKKLAKDAKEFTIATDYDIEGEVIGLNVIKFACKKPDANRMKFSTLTKDDIVKAYEKKQKTLDWGQANAGTTRHELDWYYGINISRALMSALKKAGTFKVMSSGRVQGPALKMLVDKEKEIAEFVPEAYYVLTLNGNLAAHPKESEQIEAVYTKDKIFDKEEAERIYSKVKDEKEGRVKDIARKEFKHDPPVPFDLTSFQIEAYRVFKIDPKRLLELAQNLYINGFISYPRTSSQKLPKEIDYKKILSDLKRNTEYTKLASDILSRKELKPNEGKKDDPAHPAIYPTGIMPENLNPYEKKAYDLVVKRFLACFSDPALRETMSINIDVREEIFVARAVRTKIRGWYDFYEPYVRLEETELPDTKENEAVLIKSIRKDEKETSPPKRYTQASIIKELEKRDLGTKATRASIIDALYQRGYVNDKSIQATKLGIRTCEILEKYSPDIMDEELTRHFEAEMEQIRTSEKTPVSVLNEAQDVLKKVLGDFRNKEKDIGTELKNANFETINDKNTIGTCPKCKEGTLLIKTGKFGRFIACNKYPDCKTTFKIPPKGLIKPTDKPCERCGYPMITISNSKKNGAGNALCINPDCPSRSIESLGDKNLEKQVQQITSGAVEKECPKCKTGKMILRKSIYGMFLGCSNYPKCKNIEKLQNSNPNQQGTAQNKDVSQPAKSPSAKPAASKSGSQEKPVKSAKTRSKAKK